MLKTNLIGLDPMTPIQQMHHFLHQPTDLSVNPKQTNVKMNEMLSEANCANDFLTNTNGATLECGQECPEQFYLTLYKSNLF